MKGQHHIIIEAPRLKYEFTIKRNITLIQGDSATGKTTLIDLIRDYGRNASPIRITSDVTCVVFNGAESEWNYYIQGISDSIIFIDEGFAFIRTPEFADTIRNTDNYYVLITRDALPCLPYSIHEIYGIRTSGKYHFPEQIYHEFYPIYDKMESKLTDPEQIIILDEDSRSGYLFFKKSCQDSPNCISAEGNSNIYQIVRKIDRTNRIVVIADGAAFGAFIAKVLNFARYRKNILLYLPESFEWMILKSGVLELSSVNTVLEHPEEYIDSSLFFSWEQFFTEYLTELTKKDSVTRYQKRQLNSFYLEGKNQKKILDICPEEVQQCIQMLANSQAQKS